MKKYTDINMSDLTTMPIKRVTPNPKGSKRPWGVITPESNLKRSKTLTGKFFAHKNINYLPSEIRHCAYCGKEVKVKGRNQRSQKNSYCNRKCMAEAYKGRKPYNYLGGPQTVKCTLCGKEFKRTYSEAHKRKTHFCSTICEGIWKSQNVRGELVYNWKGGYKNHTGVLWHQQQMACRERDKNVCRICGKTKAENGNKNMSVDCRIPEVYFRGDFRSAYSLDNLWCLCSSCHSKKTAWSNNFKTPDMSWWLRMVEKRYPITATLDDFRGTLL